MANLTNSAKLIEEMERKVDSSSLATVATSGSYTDLSNKPTIPTVNDSTITIQKNGADVESFTTNAAAGKTINIQLTKADVGLGNVDNTSDANKPISNATQTALNAKADANSVYTKAEVDSAISSAVSSVYKYKGSVANYASLPTTGLIVGDVYNVEDTGDNYAWTGTAWDKLAGTVDLSSYLTKTEASSTYATKTEVEQGLDNKLDEPTNQTQGTVGQVLKKTANGSEWGDAPTTGVISSNNTYEDMVHLSQAEYEALETKDPNTFYSTPDDESGAFEPENEGTEGQVLTKTSTGYAFEDTQGNVELPYLCFTANLAGSTVKLRKQGSPTAVTLETSTDGNTWNNYTFDTDITLSNVGDKVYFRNTSTTDTGFSTAYDNYYQFVMTGSIASSGDVNYLLNKNSTTTLSDNCYYYLFKDCTSLTSSPQLKSTILKNNCYAGMFYGCTNLTLSPQLPATSLAEYCYVSMFHNCKRLAIAPQLPATTLERGCYRYMFVSCYSLTSAPVLPATTLTYQCYEQMFQGCYSLAASPELPATTLAEYCYSWMFNNCKSLVTLPRLPATTLPNYCYQNMFNGCINIKVDTTSTSGQNSYAIPFSGTGTSDTSSLYNMFAFTGGTLKGTPSINTTYYTFNYPV